MFTYDNYSFAGADYDYDALNAILSERLNGSTYPDDIKNKSDAINDDLVFEGKRIMCGDVQVGVLTENDQPA